MTCFSHSELTGPLSGIFGPPDLRPWMLQTYGTTGFSPEVRDEVLPLELTELIYRTSIFELGSDRLISLVLNQSRWSSRLLPKYYISKIDITISEADYRYTAECSELRQRLGHLRNLRNPICPISISIKFRE